MPAIAIRIAGPADLGVMRRFEQAIVAAERPFDPTLREDSVEYYDIAALLASDSARVVLAEDGGKAIGCGFARVDVSKPYLRHARHAYLGLMYTDPAYRGAGVNRQIVDALAGWCRNRGVTELRLDVYAGNAPAISAYRKAGFTPHLVEMRLGLTADEPD